MEYAFVLLIFYQYSNAWHPFLYETSLMLAISLLEIMVATVLIVAGVIMYRSWSVVWKGFGRTGLVWLLVLLAFISTAWSIHPKVTEYCALGQLVISGFGLFLGLRYTVTQQLRLLAYFILFCALASVLRVIVSPGEAIGAGKQVGAWNGLFFHKNIFGMVMALGVLVNCILIMAHKPGRMIYCTGGFLCAGLMFRAKSVTSLVALVFALACLGLLVTLKKAPNRASRNKRLLYWLAGSAVLALIAFFYMDGLLELLGRDATLTGRTGIWTILVQKAKMRFWLGYGFEAFWDEGRTFSGQVAEELGNYPYHAHNAYLDMMLMLGMIGLLVFLVCIGIGLFRAFRQTIGTKTMLDLWPAVFLVFFAIISIAESHIFQTKNLLWVIFVSSLAVSTMPKAATEENEIEPAMIQIDAVKIH